MTAPERQAIFQFVTAVLEEQLKQRCYSDFPYDGRVSDTIAFLAAFDVPIADFLTGWQESPERLVRANLCAFLADYTLNNAPRKLLLNSTYITRLTFLSENQTALDALFMPSAVGSYLLTHINDWEIFDDGWRLQIETAYDWSSRAAKML